MIRLTLGGQPVLDPLHEEIDLRARGQAAPPELGRCDSLLNPLGREPARGWFCMLRSDLLRAGVDNALTLTIEDEGNKNRATVAGLTVTKEPKSLTTDLRLNAADSSMLVEVADTRWLCKNPYFSVPCDRQYNVRAPAYGATTAPTIYSVDSLNGGTAWTWASMVADLWGLLPSGMGAAPALPFSPDGVPNDWVFPGVSVWDALCDVLDRLSCAVRWTATTNVYDIVRVGAVDRAADTLLAAAAGRKVFDGEYIPLVRGREPAVVRVFFHRRELYAGTEETNTRATNAAWQLLHSYHVDVTGGGVGAVTGTVQALWDDLPALYNAVGTLTNGAALATRAAERAADYYRTLRTGGRRLHQTYSGLLTLAPGSTVKGVAWRFRGATPDGNGGLFTEVVRHPYRFVRADDNGQWEECCTPASVAVKPPFFGPQWPVYPITDQVLRVITAVPFTVDGDSLFNCTLEKASGAAALADRDPVWGFDLAGATELGAGNYYLCRLTYQAGATERQAITVVATGGYWTITGSATHLAWNETAANVEAVVDAVTGLAVVVTGPNGGPYVLTWPDGLPHALLTGDGSHLTGPSHSLTFAELLRGGWRPVYAFRSVALPGPGCPPIRFLIHVTVVCDKLTGEIVTTEYFSDYSCP